MATPLHHNHGDHGRLQDLIAELRVGLVGARAGYGAVRDAVRQEVLGVAAIGARARSVFLQCWLNGMLERFNPGGYTGHSTVLAHELGQQIPAALRVLGSGSFYQPGWSESAMARLFASSELLDKSQLERWSQGVYGIHLFESHANFQRWAADLSLEEILHRDCKFSRLLQPLMQASLD